MKKEKLEMVVATLELLLVTLKEELKSPTKDPFYNEVVSYLNEEDVDEYYEEDLNV